MRSTVFSAHKGDPKGIFAQPLDAVRAKWIVVSPNGYDDNAAHYIDCRTSIPNTTIVSFLPTLYGGPRWYLMPKSPTHRGVLDDTISST